MASEEEALDAFQESLRIRRRLAKRLPDDARFVNDLAYTLGNMSSIHEKNGGYDEALSLLDEAMQAQRGLVAKNSQTPGLIADLARTLSNRGNILAKAGRLGESQSVLSEAKDLLEPVVESDTSAALPKRDLAGIYRNAGYTATYLNDVAAAQQSYRQAIDILSELHREQPTVLGNVLGLAKIQAAVGRLCLSQGQYREARQAATDAIKLITDLPGDSETQNKSLGGVLRVAYRVRSVALARLNELTEAKADWDRMLSTAAYVDDLTVDRMIGPFYLPAWSGQADGAVAIAALAQQGIVFRTLHPELCYRFAETLALAAEQAETAQVAENHARNAVLWLERAEDAGFFQWNTKHMLHSQVFRTLDQRDDFHSLLERLANASQANSPGGRSSR